MKNAIKKILVGLAVFISIVIITVSLSELIIWFYDFSQHSSSTMRFISFIIGVFVGFFTSCYVLDESSSDEQ